MYTMTEFCEKVGLHRSTVINLEKKGIIKPLRTPGGVRRFTDEHVKQVYEYYYRKNVSNMNNKRVVVYCRVSTKKQEDYLKNQIEACKNFAISNGLVVTDVITDIASSFNFSRKGLNKLIELICKYEVSHVIIYDEDRLSRIAFKLFETLFKQFNVELIVVDKVNNSKEKLDEITSELVSFIHYITSKIYGKRNYKKYLDKICNSKPIKEIENDEDG